MIECNRDSFWYEQKGGVQSLEILEEAGYTRTIKAVYEHGHIVYDINLKNEKTSGHRYFLDEKQL